MKDLKIGFAITGSFCTIDEIFSEIENLIYKGAIVYPIVSQNVFSMDTRFTDHNNVLQKLFEITGNKVITNIQDAEPIGPKNFLDVLVVAPCTGNTISKIANAITDTTITMAVKAHLRNEKPVVIAISSNDALSANGKNIGSLLNTKNIYFVPFYQDNPIVKTRSLISKNSLIYDTILVALKGKQIQPIIYKGL